MPPASSFGIGKASSEELVRPAVHPKLRSSDRFRFLRSLSLDRNVKNRTKEQLDAYWPASTHGANGAQLPLLPSGLDDPRCAHQLNVALKTSDARGIPLRA
jgi:hypothetical protein